MDGIIFKLFKLFIMETYDYSGWGTIQEIALKKRGGPGATEANFFHILAIAKDILSEEQTVMLHKFGKYCFSYLMTNSSVGGNGSEAISDIFLYSDPLINFKIKKLDEIEQFGWEINGELKFSLEHRDANGKTVLCRFVEGFLAAGDNDFSHELSLYHVHSSARSYDTCKIKVLVNQ